MLDFIIEVFVEVFVEILFESFASLYRRGSRTRLVMRVVLTALLGACLVFALVWIALRGVTALLWLPGLLGLVCLGLLLTSLPIGAWRDRVAESVDEA